MKICTEPDKPIGFRPTNRGTGWRAWVGPVLLSRVHSRRFGWWSSRAAGWDGPAAYSLTALGLSLSLTFQSREAQR